MEHCDLTGRGVTRSQEGTLLLQWHRLPTRAGPSQHHVDIHLHPDVLNSVGARKGLGMLPHVQRRENLVRGQE
eukprot:6194253-Alexandrium_andersonii.AAC.1